jgi:hypothetical protein
MAFAPLPLIALLIFGVINFRKRPDAASHARFLRHAAFGFIAFRRSSSRCSSSLDDPGGLAAVGWIASWPVPLVGLILLAWYQPSLALRAFVALTARCWA